MVFCLFDWLIYIWGKNSLYSILSFLSIESHPALFLCSNSQSLQIVTVIIIFRYTHAFTWAGYKYLWRDKEHILHLFYSLSMCNRNLAHRFDIWRCTHNKALIWMHTLTLSHLPMRNIRQQLRLPPSIWSKI